MKLNKKFDSKYIFKIAKKTDLKQIMNFLSVNWEPKNHILSKNIKFFLYEFLNKDNLNFFWL